MKAYAPNATMTNTNAVTIAAIDENSGVTGVGDVAGLVAVNTG